MDVDSLEEHCNYCTPYKHREKFSEDSGLLSGLDQVIDSFRNVPDHWAEE